MKEHNDFRKLMEMKLLLTKHLIYPRYIKLEKKHNLNKTKTLTFNKKR